jgi:drug/metabolite transporter (DMT)-like permease
LITTAPTREAALVGRTEWLAAVAVVGVALAWGVSFSVVKATLSEVSPSRLVGWRFVVATLTLLALRPRVLRGLDRRTLRRGMWLGALLGTGFVLCTHGMQTTSVLISAFVTGTTVVFAPIIAWIWLRRRPAIRAATAVFLALAGLGLITVRSFAASPGMPLILTAAILWAVHLVALEQWSRAGRLYALTVVQMAASAAVAIVWQLLINDRQGLWPAMSLSAAAATLFLGAAATGAAFVTLSWAQTRLDATTSAVILTLEPLVGAGLGAALGDSWTAATLGGAIAVIAAVYLIARPGIGTARDGRNDLRCRAARRRKGRQIGRNPKMITRPDTVHGPIENPPAGYDVKGRSMVVAAYEDVVDTPPRLEFPLAALASRGQRVLGRECVSRFARVSGSPSVAIANAAAVEGLCTGPVTDARGIRPGVQIAHDDDV